MSDITSQSLTSLVKNIKEKKLSSEELPKLLLIVLKNQKN